MASDDTLLKEIQDNWKYQSTQWRDIHEDGRLDMLAISGDIWGANDPDGKTERGKTRLMVSMDELNQYVNPLINDVRQNKRAVKVSPKGGGASEITAQMRGGMIRQIEYKSKAQAAYLTGFEGAVQRGYGAWKYNTQYVSDSAFEQEIVVQRIPNPDVVYMDWDAKEKDFSDADHAFEVETYRKDAFNKRWPDAKYQSFGAPEAAMAPGWVMGEDRIQVASYWKVRKKTDTLFLRPDNTTLALSTLKQDSGKKPKVNGNFIEIDGQDPIEFVGQRKTEERQVVQYITNGLEILETNAWPGKYIPIVYVTGKEIYVDDGSGPKRKLLSMVRLARQPLMAYAYLWTTQLEIVQRMPKMPLIGYEGQFDTTTDWQNINKIVTAYAEVKATTPQSEAANRAQILPIPQIPSFAVDLQSLEVCKQTCRQAIQAACGVPPGLLEGRGPNADPKSGIALRTLDQQESASNFHFIDNYDGGLEFGGRIMDDLLGPVYDTPRSVGMRDAKGDQAVVPINKYHPQSGEKLGFHTDQGEHDITISTGPSFDSQRDEVNQFEESLTKTGDPMLTRALLPSIIKNKNLGPLGDEMAAIAEKLSPLNQPQQQVPPQMQLAIQKMSQRLQQLEFERKAKILDNQAKLQLEQTKQAGAAWKVTQEQSVDLEKTRMNNEAIIDQALAKNGQDAAALQYEAMNARLIQMWEMLHEFTQNAMDRQHEKELSAQEHQQTLQQGQQQAALNPPQPAAVSQ